MESVRKIIHGSSLRVVGLGVTILVGFFIMPFLVHHLGDQLYGYWALIGSILGYYGILDLGVTSAVQFYVAKALGEKDLEAANRAISTSFFAFGVLGSIILVVTFLLAFLSHLFVHDAAQAALFRNVLLIMGIGAAIGFPGRAFLGALSAHLRWDLISIIGLSTLLLRTAIIVAAIEAGGGLVALALAAVVTDVLGCVCYYLVLRRIQHPVHVSAAYATLSALKGIVRYSAFTFIVKISDQLRFYIDVWVVGAFLSVSVVTHYAISSRLAMSFMDVMIALIGLLNPWFTLLLGSKDYGGIRRVLKFGTKVSVSFATIIALLLIVYGREFIHGWMGANYVDAYWPLAILVAGIFCDVAQQPSVAYLFGSSLNRFLAQITLFEAIANVILSLYWVRIYGMAGVALGTAVPMLLVKLFVQPVYVCRKSEISLWEYYVGLFGRSALAGAIGVIVPWLILFRWASGSSLFVITPLIVVQALIAIVAAYFLAFDSAERSQINRGLLSALRIQAPAVTPEAARVEPLS